MKVGIIHFLIFLFLVRVVEAQQTQLVYLKVLPGTGALTYYEGDSIFVAFNTDSGSATDFSIFPDSPQYIIEPPYLQSPIVYDFNLNPLLHFKITSSYPSYDFVKRDGENFIFNSNPTLSYSTNEFNTEPLLTGEYPNIIYGNRHALTFQAQPEPVLSMPLHCFCYDVEALILNPHSIPNFKDAVNLDGSNLSKSAYLNDGTIITTYTMTTDAVINWDNTVPIDENEWGTLWVKLNPLTGEYNTSSILSENGSVIPRQVFSSQNHDFIYRTGTLRGHNLEVSPDGTIWENSPQDSLYHVFIVKEDGNGAQEWMHELYSYNDTWSDLNPASGGPFYFEDTPDLIEIENSIYLNNFVKLNAQEGDSILFRDFHGNSSLHYPPEDFDIPISYVGYRSHSIFHFNQDGSALGSLSLPIESYSNFDLNSFYASSSSSLFKIENKLAWSHSYRSTSDTTLYFLKKDMAGIIDSIQIDLPAGRGAYILWLNENLDILESTLIPYTTNYFASIGLVITDGSIFNGDSLLLTGTIQPGTTTTLDPEGLAEEITYDGVHNFLGFYALPQVLSTRDYIPKNRLSFQVYPNPGNDMLTLKSEFLWGAEYEVFDLSGKLLLRGTLANSNTSSLNIKKLNSGMYLLKITTKNGVVATEKFAKE